MKLFSWGTNSHGQLGLGFKSELIEVPTQVSLDPHQFSIDGAFITGGGNHTILKTKSGKVYGAGLNSSGELCFTGEEAGLFEIVPPLSLECISTVVCGWDFTLFLTSKGKLYGSGSNKFGQLGNLPVFHDAKALVEISTDQLKNIVHVSAGLRHCAALTISGSVFIWGSDKYVKMDQVQGLKEISKIVCGQQHVVAMDVTGKVIAWGANHYGQCGQNSASKLIIHPAFVEWDDSNGKIIDIVSGWSHSILLTDRGDVFTFGRNTYGQLGRICENDHLPRKVIALENVVSIAAGSEHSMALDKSGQLWTWGWNEHGSCGNGNLVNQFQPINISHQFSGKVVSIGCGAGHCFAVVEPFHK